MKTKIQYFALGIAILTFLFLFLVYLIPFFTEVTPEYIEIGWNQEVEFTSQKILQSDNYLELYQIQAAKYRNYAKIYYEKNQVEFGDRASLAWYNLLSDVQAKWTTKLDDKGINIMTEEIDNYKNLLEEIDISTPITKKIMEKLSTVQTTYNYG